MPMMEQPLYIGRSEWLSERCSWTEWV